MDAIQMIKERRSIRNFTEEKVSRETIKEIIEVARFAPSWVNYQIARYNIIDDEQLIGEIQTKGVNNFVYNINTLKNAKGVVVLSYVKGKSGKLDLESDQYATSGKDGWEQFDAGIACQTFCLAAHAYGVGTCIMGVIDHDSLKKIAKLPEEETVAAVIVYGYPQEAVAATPRKSVEEITRFID